MFDSVAVEFILDEYGYVNCTITLLGITSNITQESGAVPENQKYAAVLGVVLDLKTIDNKSIRILDIHNPETTFAIASRLGPYDCAGKYAMDYENNKLYFYFESVFGDAVDYKIQFRYNPLNYSTKYANSSGMVYRNVSFVFPHSKEPYTAEYSVTASDNLILSQESGCIAGWDYIIIKGGFSCIDMEMLPPDESGYLVLALPLCGEYRALKSFDEEPAVLLKIEKPEYTQQEVIIFIILGLGVLIPLRMLFKYYKRPVLNIYFNKSQTYDEKFDHAGTGKNWGMFVHIIVDNTGRSDAKRCLGYLVEVEENDSFDSFTPSPNFKGPVKLHWDHDAPGGGWNPLDVIKYKPRKLDVCFVHEGDPRLHFFTEEFPHGFQKGFGPGEYRIKITVSADNVKPISEYFIIRWDGDWMNLRMMWVPTINE